MNRLGLVFAFIAMFSWHIFAEVWTDYDYSNHVESYWDLGVKASTLQQKTIYLDQYVAALEASGLQGSHDALIFDTPDNSFDQNMVALKSLQGRMHQIQGMDEQSFAYQTAMQQIVGQEQGEAGHLTATFQGCWYLRNHFLLYGWADGIRWLVELLVALIFVIGVLSE